jgi:hypothetical protein
VAINSVSKNNYKAGGEPLLEVGTATVRSLLLFMAPIRSEGTQGACKGDGAGFNGHET